MIAAVRLYKNGISQFQTELSIHSTSGVSIRTTGAEEIDEIERVEKSAGEIECEFKVQPRGIGNRQFAVDR